MSKLKFENTQYAKSGRRGRPPGSRNKVLILKDKDNRSEVSDFAETLKEWDRMEAESNKTDWETIAKKQEDRLKAYIAENEELAKICIMRWEEISHLKYLVTYLERKNEDSSV
jgi:hypothetical protein